MSELRSATSSDADAIASLHARSWRENYRGAFLDAFLDGDLPGERLAVWRARLERPADNQLVEVAIDGAQLAGFVCVYGAHDPRWGSLIDNLHVARECKRSGIGSALLARAADWLAAHHTDTPVYLLVLESNTPARSFYARLGGHDEGASTMESHGGARVRSCRYTWTRPQRLRAGAQRG